MPLNLLGGQGKGRGTITPEMLRWIGFVRRDSSEQALKSFIFNVTGDLAELPAGPLAFAAGIERRSQNGRFDPDPVVSAGDTAGQPAQPTAGGFRVTEWYGEIEAPLVSSASGADLIDISGSDPLLRLQHVRQRHDRQDRSALATRPEPAVARHLDRGLPRAEHRRTVRRSDAPRCGHLGPMRGFPHHQRRPNRDRQLHRCGRPRRRQLHAARRPNQRPYRRQRTA